MHTAQNSDLTAETEVLTALYDAINRNDIPAALEYLHPEIERIEPAAIKSAGTYRGHAEVRSHWSQAREAWAEGACTPEQFMSAGDKVVVFVHVRVRLKNQQDWIEGRIADGFTFSNDKVIFMQTFVERQQALDWAGIDV